MAMRDLDKYIGKDGKFNKCFDPGPRLNYEYKPTGLHLFDPKNRPIPSTISDGGVSDQLMAEYFEKEANKKESWNASRWDHEFSWELPKDVELDFFARIYPIFKGCLKGEGIFDHIKKFACRRYGCNYYDAVPGIRLYYDHDLPPRKPTNSGLQPREGTYEEVLRALAESFDMTFEFVRVAPPSPKLPNTSVWDGFGDGLYEEWRMGMGEQYGGEKYGNGCG